MGVLSETQSRNENHMDRMQGLIRLREWLRDDGNGHVGWAVRRIRQLEAEVAILEKRLTPDELDSEGNVLP